MMWRWLLFSLFGWGYVFFDEDNNCHERMHRNEPQKYKLRRKRFNRNLLLMVLTLILVFLFFVFRCYIEVGNYTMCKRYAGNIEKVKCIRERRDNCETKVKIKAVKINGSH